MTIVIPKFLWVAIKIAGDLIGLCIFGLVCLCLVIGTMMLLGTLTR